MKLRLEADKRYHGVKDADLSVIVVWLPEPWYGFGKSSGDKCIDSDRKSV